MDQVSLNLDSVSLKNAKLIASVKLIDLSTPSTDDSPTPSSDDASTPDDSTAQPVNSEEGTQITPDDSSYQQPSSDVEDGSQPQAYETVPYTDVDPSQQEQGGGEYYPQQEGGGYDQGYVPSQYDPQGYSQGQGGYDPQSYAGEAQYPQNPQGGYYTPQDSQTEYNNSPSPSESQDQSSPQDTTRGGGGDTASSNQDAANTLASLIADSLGGVTK